MGFNATHFYDKIKANQEDQSMSLMIAPESITTKLSAADSPIEMCATDGRVLGYFTPAKSKLLAFDPGISDEEMASRVAAGGGRSLSEILRDLEASL